MKDGNILQAKSILDSLRKNHQLKSEMYPEFMRSQIEALLMSMDHSQKELKLRLTPRKKETVETQAN
jgi:hypothetical protein